ncbi:hypothetical protein [Adhaeribacter pallidiroseus]|uniref:Uncharacterized protein n=1 Tax=Adhaeribacter pallidiroseus TaxID=2072847 RepID=A0A369QR69_9BACT|nr:hypothetical protein [Adhaeribacter pallidiroseus]RDC66165.1 hypothetical protein AHMF7616_04796 [Adhaeribacter pallidiroseus]
MSKVLFLFIFSAAICSCNTFTSSKPGSLNQNQELSLKPEITPYTTKYAGNYTVKSDHYALSDAKEIYVLKYDGTAKWMFVDVNENIPLEKAKYGIWRVNGSILNISYQEDNHVETEHFVLEDGCFYDKNSGKRYLQLTQLAQVPF